MNQPIGSYAHGSIRQLLPNQPNELIETIEKALEASTPGPWEVTKDEFGDSIVKSQVNSVAEEVIVTNFRDSDIYLIANAPEWLHALLEENKRQSSIISDLSGKVNRLTDEYNEVCSHRKVMQDTMKEREELLQQAREDLAYNKKMYDQLHDSRKDIEKELRRVEAEREQVKEGWIESFKSLHTELAAKDKVLEWYANKEMFIVPYIGCTSQVMIDRGDRARTILQSYPPREKGADNEA